MSVCINTETINVVAESEKRETYLCKSLININYLIDTETCVGLVFSQ